MSDWPSGAVNKRPAPVDMKKILEQVAKDYPNGITAIPSKKVSKNYTVKNNPSTFKHPPKKPWANKFHKQWG